MKISRFFYHRLDASSKVQSRNRSVAVFITVNNQRSSEFDGRNEVSMKTN